MNFSNRIKNAVFSLVLAGSLLPAMVTANTPPAELSPGLQQKMAQFEHNLQANPPQDQTELAQRSQELFDSLTPEEQLELEALQNNSAPTAAISPDLQEKLQKLTTEAFKDVDLSSITPEEYAQLEEQVLSQLTEEERHQLEAAHQAHQAMNHKVLSVVLEQLNGIMRIGQFLADALNHEQVKPKDPAAALRYVQEITGLVHELHNQCMTTDNISMEMIERLLALSNYMAHHLKYSIGTNLNDIKEINIEKALKRSQELGISSIEDLEAAFNSNARLLEELDAQAQWIGLAFYQRGFRKLEALDTKYNIRWNALKISVLSAIAAITIHKLSGDSLKDIPGVNWIKENLVGDSFAYDKKTGQLITQIPVLNEEGKLSGAISRNYTKFGSCYDALTNRLGWFGDMLQPAVGLGSLYTFLLPDAIKWYTWSQEKLSGLAAKLRGEKARYVFGGRREPKLTFDDQIGQTHIKQQMSRYISYLLDTQKYEHRGIGITCNVLFAGKTRTGKTFMAEAFVGELNKQLKARGKDPVQFLIFSKNDIEQFGFKHILEYARDNAPCIVFIDEIDMLGLQPEQNSALLQEFLTALSGAMESKLSGVCFLAATNRPESLYKSLVRRFDKVIWFDYPPYKDRKEAFARDLANHAIMASPEFIERIARESEGSSFEDLHRIIVYAGQAAETERRAIRESDLQQAADSVLWKIEPKACNIPDEQRRIVATHLAGEAFVRSTFPCHYELAKVTIRDVVREIQESPSYMRYDHEASDEPTEMGKVLTYNPYHGKQINQPSAIENECKVALAGHCAENVILGGSGHMYHQDDASRALAIANYIQREGVDESLLSKEIKTEIQVAAHNLVENYKQEITQLLENNKETVQKIADALLERETLSRADIDAIINATENN